MNRLPTGMFRIAISFASNAARLPWDAPKKMEKTDALRYPLKTGRTLSFVNHPHGVGYQAHTTEFFQTWTNGLNQVSHLRLAAGYSQADVF